MLIIFSWVIPLSNLLLTSDFRLMQNPLKWKVKSPVAPNWVEVGLSWFLFPPAAVPPSLLHMDQNLRYYQDEQNSVPQYCPRGYCGADLYAAPSSICTDLIVDQANLIFQAALYCFPFGSMLHIRYRLIFLSAWHRCAFGNRLGYLVHWKFGISSAAD